MRVGVLALVALSKLAPRRPPRRALRSSLELRRRCSRRSRPAASSRARRGATPPPPASAAGALFIGGRRRRRRGERRRLRADARAPLAVVRDAVEARRPLRAPPPARVPRARRRARADARRQVRVHRAGGAHVPRERVADHARGLRARARRVRRGARQPAERRRGGAAARGVRDAIRRAAGGARRDAAAAEEEAAREGARGAAARGGGAPHADPRGARAARRSSPRASPPVRSAQRAPPATRSCYATSPSASRRAPPPRSPPPGRTPRARSALASRSATPSRACGWAEVARRALLGPSRRRGRARLGGDGADGHARARAARRAARAATKAFRRAVARDGRLNHACSPPARSPPASPQGDDADGAADDDAAGAAITAERATAVWALALCGLAGQRRTQRSSRCRFLARRAAPRLRRRARAAPPRRPRAECTDRRGGAIRRGEIPASAELTRRLGAFLPLAPSIAHNVVRSLLGGRSLVYSTRVLDVGGCSGQSLRPRPSPPPWRRVPRAPPRRCESSAARPRQELHPRLCGSPAFELLLTRRRSPSRQRSRDVSSQPSWLASS